MKLEDTIRLAAVLLVLGATVMQLRAIMELNHATTEETKRMWDAIFDLQNEAKAKEPKPA